MVFKFFPEVSANGFSRIEAPIRFFGMYKTLKIVSLIMGQVVIQGGKQPILIVNTIKNITERVFIETAFVYVRHLKYSSRRMKSSTKNG